MLRLPDEHRVLFKKPFGTLYPDIGDIIPLIRGKVIYSVGDVVTHNLMRRGILPHVAIIDGHTMRAPCTLTPLLKARRTRAYNPPGTLSEELIERIDEAVAHPPSVIFVEGEEDLAVIPMVIAAPEGALVLYGQPGEGVVVKVVDREAKVEAERLLALFIRE
jgi:GTP-dependent dephospho-CoA kinase